MAHELVDTMQANELNAQKLKEQEQKSAHRWLSFNLSNKRFALPVDDVIEVVRQTDIASIPGSNEHVLGVANIRGQIVIVLDIRKRLNLTVELYSDTNRILVVEIDDMLYGLLVDKVLDVLELDESAVAWENQHANDVSATAQWADETVQLVDLQHVLNNEE
ncbi:MAG: purine-binding chemotaxis protein CheW [Enterobacterales bacterium]|nr:purine-binding chemotaxis protein CheW [Enterobacterales bacterium]